MHRLGRQCLFRIKEWDAVQCRQFRRGDKMPESMEPLWLHGVSDGPIPALTEKDPSSNGMQKGLVL